MICKAGPNPPCHSIRKFYLMVFPHSNFLAEDFVSTGPWEPASLLVMTPVPSDEPGSAPTMLGLSCFPHLMEF